MIEALLICTFTITLGTVTWLVWRERDRARAQALQNARLAELGRRVDELAHDVRGRLGVIQFALESANDLPEPHRSEAMRDIEAALIRADEIMLELREDAGTEPSEPHSPLDVLQQLVTVYRAAGWAIELEVTGTLNYVGARAHVVAVFHNLLSNATRALAEVGEGRILVEMSDEEISVANPFRGPLPLGGRMYERGVSGASSSGVGLARVVEHADAIGWGIEHIIDGDVIRFAVRREVGTAATGTHQT